MDLEEVAVFIPVWILLASLLRDVVWRSTLLANIVQRSMGLGGSSLGPACPPLPPEAGSLNASPPEVLTSWVLTSSL